MSAPQVFLTETRERFLKAVVAELPADRIRELYLFAPIRQGGVESGVAVIAAELPETADAMEAAEALGSESAAIGTAEAVGSESAGIGAVEAVGSESAGIGTGYPQESDASDSSNPTAGVASLTDMTGVRAEVDACSVDPEAGAAGASTGAASEHFPADSDPAIRPSTPNPRYTVYTARYRHTQKGPERGKWESSVVAEADAPLLSIETVVRGVQRRSGDVDPPDHMSGDEVRNALRLTPADRA